MLFTDLASMRRLRPTHALDEEVGRRDRDRTGRLRKTALTLLHGLFEPVAGADSWGWAIIALTLVVRIALLPLAIRQARSMRAAQALQPQLKALKEKHKVDRSLLKKNPEKYKAKKAKSGAQLTRAPKDDRLTHHQDHRHRRPSADNARGRHLPRQR